jgi:hypothetical protein
VRLHFAGRFQADPSTVNNQTSYYDNATFEELYKKNGGLWNPEGGGAWRFVDCRVTRVCYADGSSTTDPKVDPVVGMSIMDANKRVAGKLVDLDPQQQMVSEIWSLIVRLTDGTVDSFAGPFATAAFTDLWQRAMVPGRPKQQSLSAIYQSVIAPVAWGDTSKSRFLGELRKAAADDILSIKFNVDGYDRDSTIPTFTLGRMTGSIGPASADEPRQFVLGRHLGGTDLHMNYMPCVVDAKAKVLIADFGNAIATHKPGGEIMNIGAIAIGYIDNNSGRVVAVGNLEGYSAPGWYESTAGVQAFPLTDAAISALASSVMTVAINGQPFLQENVDGLYVRADQFVYRLSPGDTADVQLYATQYGVLQDGAPIVVSFDPSQLQGSTTGHPPVGTPTSAVTGFDPNTPIIANNGRALLQLKAGSLTPPPRGFVDGQVYGVRPLPQTVAQNAPGSWVNPADFVSLLVWEPFDTTVAPTWYGNMQPIFTQYGHLYPLMDKIIDLTSYDAIAANTAILIFVFSLPVSDPNSMPVTRDLSPAKRAAILQWLKTPGPDGKPLLGTPPPPKLKAAPMAAAAPAAAETATPPPRNELFRMKSGLEEE